MKYRNFVKLAKMTSAEKDLAKHMYAIHMLSGGIAGGMGGGLVGGIGGLFAKKNKFRNMLKWMLLGGLGGGALGMGGGAVLGHSSYKRIGRLADEMDEKTRDYRKRIYKLHQDINKGLEKPLTEMPLPYDSWRQLKAFPYSDLADYIGDKSKEQEKQQNTSRQVTR